MHSTLDREEVSVEIDEVIKTMGSDQKLQNSYYISSYSVRSESTVFKNVLNILNKLNIS